MGCLVCYAASARFLNAEALEAAPGCVAEKVKKKNGRVLRCAPEPTTLSTKHGLHGPEKKVDRISITHVTVVGV